MSRISTHRIKTIRTILLSALVTLLLAACTHSEPRSEYSIPRHATGKTLGDLKRVDITLHAQSLESVSVGKVISTYTQALSLFSKPAERHAILKRMADLTMVGTEEKLLAQISSEDAEEQPSPQQPGQDTTPQSPQVAIDMSE